MDNLIYKFYSAHWGRDALYRERFKVTTLSDINDPFEFLATSTQKGLRNSARKLRLSEFEKEGVISFSRTWQEPLLWSHYAQNHQAIALGFELSNPKYGYEIEYSDKRVQMFDRHNQKAFAQLKFWNEIRTRKYCAWEYEQETRVFPSLNGSISENGLYFTPFDHLGRLRQVILGAGYQTINDLELNAKLENQGVEIITARLGFREFRVERQKQKTRQKVI